MGSSIAVNLVQSTWDERAKAEAHAIDVSQLA